MKRKKPILRTLPRGHEWGQGMKPTGGPRNPGIKHPEKARLYRRVLQRAGH